MACIKQTIFHFIVWIFNIVHKICRLVGWEIVPLTINDVIAPLTQDERKVILQQCFNEPISLILRGCNDPGSKITGFQRYHFLQMIRRNVKTCAAIRLTVSRNPDILNTPVDGPLVIVGLPRSGTTMLQRLLACDPQFVSPMIWEMIEPTPHGRTTFWKDTERYRKAQNKFDLMTAFMTEKFKSIHFVSMNEYEECQVILGNHFIHSLFSSVPDMEKWRHFQFYCPKLYQLKAYQFYKKCLQCIFYNNLNNSEKLLLKTPIHLLYLDTYREVFPNAKFIFTYRHLGTSIGSLCSLNVEYSKMFGSEVDKMKHGRDKLEFFREMSLRGVSSLEKMKKDSFIAMGYGELMKDTLAAVRNIYDQVEASMQRRLVDNPQGKLGKHEYSMEEFGISDEQIKTEFKEFLEYFKDSPEKLI